MTAGFASMIWEARAPSRVKFFCWLLVQRRVHTRDVLLRKHIVDAEDAGCPLCSAALETADHMLFSCPFAVAFWRHVQVVVDGATVCKLGVLAAAVAASVESEVEFALPSCWQLWKHRNAVVFRRMPPSLARLLCCCREDAVLWRDRLSEARRSHMEGWVRAFSALPT